LCFSQISCSCFGHTVVLRRNDLLPIPLINVGAVVVIEEVVFRTASAPSRKISPKVVRDSLRGQTGNTVECLMSDNTILDVTSWMPGIWDSSSKKNRS